MDSEEKKKLVAEEASKLVENGQTIGLGTGSTSSYFIKALATRNLDIKCVSSSKRSTELAESLGLKTLEPENAGKIDLYVDGADEVSKDLDLIKGGGGAHTLEKRLAYRAERFIVIVDEGKLTHLLGDFPLPVELREESLNEGKKALEALGAKVTLRENFKTDLGNLILDCKFSAILKPAELERIINNIDGVVDNGIFSKEKVSEVLVGTDEGIRHLS
ncbi:MAG: ribose-5-phosphate isomerase RpiA [archaeon]|jgi:ribose 5-phosphate isomerase A|nr:ribose 5-phosphate isomerase A [Euryarchaeota archaeon]MDP6704261.1 ribose-5-phosphate isomerase RpiA [archaeon]HIK01094.1 ribose-5-phosphate isomerase RpiA [Candidatus Undinarchaeales archaeon ERR594346 U_76725]|tara:strand:+ start:14799 stop:15452 length:654 start_codon:yes stop_codon:yes gene_type:complete